MTNPTLDSRVREFLALVDGATPGSMGVVAVTGSHACSLIRDLQAEVERLRAGLTTLSAWCESIDRECMAGTILLFRDGTISALACDLPASAEGDEHE